MTTSALQPMHDFLDAIDLARDSIKTEIDRLLYHAVVQNAELVARLLVREVKKQDGKALKELRLLIVPRIIKITQKYFAAAYAVGEEYSQKIIDRIIKKASFDLPELAGSARDKQQAERIRQQAINARTNIQYLGSRLPKILPYKYKNTHPQARELVSGAKQQLLNEIDAKWWIRNQSTVDKLVYLALLTYKDTQSMELAREAITEPRNAAVKPRFGKQKALAIKLQNKQMLIARLDSHINEYVIKTKDLISTILLNGGNAKATAQTGIQTRGREAGTFFNAVAGSAQSYIFRVADQAAQEAFAFENIQDKMRWITFFARSCPDCISLHNKIKTYQQWQGSRWGTPRSGNTVCRSHCHCVLVPDEYKVDVAMPIKRESALITPRKPKTKPAAAVKPQQKPVKKPVSHGTKLLHGINQNIPSNLLNKELKNISEAELKQWIDGLSAKRIPKSKLADIEKYFNSHPALQGTSISINKYSRVIDISQMLWLFENMPKDNHYLFAGLKKLKIGYGSRGGILGDFEYMTNEVNVFRKAFDWPKGKFGALASIDTTYHELGHHAHSLIVKAYTQYPELQKKTEEILDFYWDGIHRATKRPGGNQATPLEMWLKIRHSNNFDAKTVVFPSLYAKTSPVETMAELFSQYHRNFDSMPQVIKNHMTELIAMYKEKLIGE